MSPSSASLLRRLLSATLLVAAAGVSTAQTGTGGGPAEDDAIAAARREFQSLRTAEKIRGEEMKLQLPDIAAPNLQQTVPPVSGPGASERNNRTASPDRKKKSDNWLVDAIMKHPEKPDEPKAWSEEDDPAQPRDPFAELIAETLRPAPKTDAGKVSAERESARDERVVEAPNPFAAYMSTWISPQQRDILLPQAQALLRGSNPERDMPAGTSGFFGGSAGRVPGGADSGPAIWSAPMPGLPSHAGFSGEAQTNPFLNGGDLAPPVTLPTMAQPQFAPPAAPMPAMPETARTRTEPPTPLAKPADDAKYFPQLKRF